MNVLDQIFDTDDYKMAVSPNVAPVVGVVAGTGQEASSLNAIVSQLCGSAYQSSNRIIFTPVKAVEFVEKKKDKSSDHYNHNYVVRGILKRDWVRRHQSVMFGCVALLFDWDAADTRDRLAFEQLVSGKVEKLRQRLRGMSTRLLLVLTTQRGSTQSAPSSGGYLGYEDALLNVRSRCGLDDKSIAILHHGETKAASRVHRCAFELCMRYHRDETNRIKKFKSDLQKTSNHSAMTARHRFKVGFHAELAQDPKLKKRNYDKAYVACRALANGSNTTTGVEIRVMSSIILQRSLSYMLASTTQEAELLLKTFQEHLQWLHPPKSATGAAARSTTSVPVGTASDEACATSLSFPLGSFDSKEEAHAAYITCQWLATELYTNFSDVMSKISHADHLRGLSGVTGRRSFAQPGMPGFNTLACAETLRSLRDQRTMLLESFSADPNWSSVSSAYQKKITPSSTPTADGDGDHTDEDEDGNSENNNTKKKKDTIKQRSRSASTLTPSESESSSALPDVDPPDFFGQEYRHCNSTKLLVRHLLVTPTMAEVSAQCAKTYNKAYGFYREMGLHSRCYALSITLAEHFLITKDYPTAYRHLIALAGGGSASTLLSSDGTGGGTHQMLMKWPAMGTTVREMLVRAIMQGKLYQSNPEELCHGVRALLMLMATLPELPNSSAATAEDDTTAIVAAYSGHLEHLKVLLAYLDEENPDKVILVDERQGKGLPSTVAAATNTLGSGLEANMANRGLFAKILTVTCGFETAYAEAEGLRPLKYTVNFTSQIPLDGLPVSDLTLLFATDGKDENHADFVVNVPLKNSDGISRTLSRGASALRHTGILRLRKPGIVECVGVMATVLDCTIFFKMDTLPARRRLLDSRGVMTVSKDEHQTVSFVGGGTYDHSKDHSAVPDMYLPHRPVALVTRPVAKARIVQVSGMTAKHHAVEGEDYQVQVTISSLGDTILPGAKLLVGCYPGVLELVGGTVVVGGEAGQTQQNINISPARGGATTSSPVPGCSSPSPHAKPQSGVSGTETVPDIYKEEVRSIDLPHQAIKDGEGTTMTLTLRCLRAGKLHINLKLDFITDTRAIAATTSSENSGSSFTAVPHLSLAVYSKLVIHVCHPVFVYFTVADTTVWDLKRGNDGSKATETFGNTALSASLADGSSSSPDGPKVYLPYDGTSGLFVESPEMRADQVNDIALVTSGLMIEPSTYQEIPGVTDGLLEDGSGGGSFGGPSTPLPGSTITSGRARSETAGISSSSSPGLAFPLVHPLQFYTAQQSQLPTETQRMSLPLNLRTDVPFMVSCRFVNSMQFPLTLHRMFLAVLDPTTTVVLSQQEPEGLLPCTIGVDEEYTFTVMLQHAGEGVKVDLGSAVLELSRGVDEEEEEEPTSSRTGQKEKKGQAALDQVFGGIPAGSPPAPIQRMEHRLPLPVANFTKTLVIVSFEYPQEVTVHKPFPLLCKVRSLSDRVQEVEVCLAPNAGGGGSSGGNGSLGGTTGGSSTLSGAPQAFLLGGRTSWNLTLPPFREKTTTFKVVPTMSGFLPLPSFMGQCQEGDAFVLWPDERRTINVVPKPMEVFLA